MMASHRGVSIMFMLAAGLMTESLNKPISQFHNTLFSSQLSSELRWVLSPLVFMVKQKDRGLYVVSGMKC